MKETDDDFEPRRDGWFEHKGTWGEVTVGTVIANKQRRSQRWEIIDVAHGKQVEPLTTLWMRAREQTTGAEFTVSPRSKGNPVIILTKDPLDTETPAPTEPSDAEAIAVLVEKLGATELATRDNVTGEITCPQFGYAPLESIEHLRIAHGLDVNGLADLPGDERAIQIETLHGQAHNPTYDIGKGGFPHRHVPEDLTLATGIRR